MNNTILINLKKWNFIVYFWYIATDAVAKVGNYPFTTIKPNHGITYYQIDCPCKKYHKEELCQPKYGIKYYKNLIFKKSIWRNSILKFQIIKSFQNIKVNVLMVQDFCQLKCLM